MREDFRLRDLDIFGGFIQLIIFSIIPNGLNIEIGFTPITRKATIFRFEFEVPRDL